jgi:hypothetical protein
MKTVKFLLPVMALLFAIVGVFATDSSKLLVQNVTATQSNCTLDGTCDQGAGNCQLTSDSNIKFYVRNAGPPVTCTVQSTGKFAE